jgi:hypothetical protein
MNANLTSSHSFILPKTKKAMFPWLHFRQLTHRASCLLLVFQANLIANRARSFASGLTGIFTFAATAGFHGGSQFSGYNRPNQFHLSLPPLFNQIPTSNTHGCSAATKGNKD